MCDAPNDGRQVAYFAKSHERPKAAIRDDQRCCNAASPKRTPLLTHGFEL